jgi:glycosyltransferase involved in cell wall biosynthesis
MNYIIIAAYNEGPRIAKVVRQTKKYGKVIVVDDGSKDTTAKEAKKAGALVATHIINMGKGAAMRTGAELAIKKGAKNLVFIDGDGQHDASEIPMFLKELENVDIVLGARRFNKNMPLVRKFGKWLTKFITQVLYGITIDDCLNGFRAMKATTYPKVKWLANNYQVEVEMISWVGKEKLKYKEVITKTIYHDAHKGVNPMHGFGIIWNLIMWRWRGR